MSLDGSTSTFIPYTLNGLSSGSFSNANIGNGTATTLQITSATPNKLARFDANDYLVSSTYGESDLITGSVSSDTVLGYNYVPIAIGTNSLANSILYSYAGNTAMNMVGDFSVQGNSILGFGGGYAYSNQFHGATSIIKNSIYTDNPNSGTHVLLLRSNTNISTTTPTLIFDADNTNSLCSIQAKRYDNSSTLPLLIQYSGGDTTIGGALKVTTATANKVAYFDANKSLISATYSPTDVITGTVSVDVPNSKYFVPKASGTNTLVNSSLYYDVSGMMVNRADTELGYTDQSSFFRNYGYAKFIKDSNYTLAPSYPNHTLLLLSNTTNVNSPVIVFDADNTNNLCSIQAKRYDNSSTLPLYLQYSGGSTILGGDLVTLTINKSNTLITSSTAGTLFTAGANSLVNSPTTGNWKLSPASGPVTSISANTNVSLTAFKNYTFTLVLSGGSAGTDPSATFALQCPLGTTVYTRTLTSPFGAGTTITSSFAPNSSGSLWIVLTKASSEFNWSLNWTSTAFSVTENVYFGLTNNTKVTGLLEASNITSSGSITASGNVTGGNIIATYGSYSAYWGRNGDLRSGAAPSNQAGGTFGFYFGTYTNDGSGNFADLLMLNSWTDSSGGSTNLMAFNKSNGAIRKYRGTYGSTSALSTYNDVVMTKDNSGDVIITGNLGINNSDPIAMLTVGDGRSGGNRGYIVVEQYYSGGTRQNKNGYDDSFNFVLAGDYGGSNTAGTWVKQIYCAYNAPADSIVVLSNGNVGMNNSTPTADLHVLLKNAVNGYWGQLKVKTTSFWGDGCSTRSETAGTQYSTIFPIMLQNPHVVSDSDGTCYIRMGRSGGVQSGTWWELCNQANGDFKLGQERGGVGITVSKNTGYVRIEGWPSYDMSYGSRVMCLNSNNQFSTGSSLCRWIVQDNQTAWGGGYNVSNAFYRTYSTSSVLLIGKFSYFASSAALTYPTVRIYSQSTGQTWYFEFRAFQNFTYGHTTYPFYVTFNDYYSYATGWFDVYIYNNGNCNTDINDQYWLTCVSNCGREW